VTGRITVIAEAGVNHNGDLSRALNMVAAAADAGADYVKFQAFIADQLVAAGAPTAVYQSVNTGKTDQVSLLRGLEIDRDGFVAIAEACRKHGIGFMATAFDTDQVTALIDLGMDQIKVASGELTNGPALKGFAVLRLPILLSTGMATLDEVGRAVDLLRGSGANAITLLHCTSLYPAPAEALNLRAMVTMADRFALPVGYSDHSLGLHASIAAAALGAGVIEKHFTLDRTLEGPDHAASLEPDELAMLIAMLRDVPPMLGDGVKAPAAGEADTAAVARRSWHAVRDLPVGHILKESDVVLKRPAGGIEGWESPAGSRLARPISADAPVTPVDLADPVKQAVV